MEETHYMRIQFGITKDNSPEIYDFLLDYMPKILKKMKAKMINVELERLEPMDPVYTNLELDQKIIKEIFREFKKAHNLHAKSSLTHKKERTSIKAKLNVKNLKGLLNDYNILFDIFFAEMQLEAKGIFIDMMDAFSNTLLVAGSKKDLEKFKKYTKELTKRKTVFKFIDHKEKKTKAKKKQKSTQTKKKKTTKTKPKTKKTVKKPAKKTTKKKAKKPAAKKKKVKKAAKKTTKTTVKKKKSKPKKTVKNKTKAKKSKVKKKPVKRKAKIKKKRA